MLFAWRNFKNIFSRPLFTIIFRPEMLKFLPYSILTGDLMVGFVIFCVLSAESWRITFGKKGFLLNRFFAIWYLFWEYFYFEKIIYNYKRYALKKMVIICCSTLTALFSWLLLHTQAKENSWHPPPNKQSQQSNPYKNYVWSGQSGPFWAVLKLL